LLVGLIIIFGIGVISALMAIAALTTAAIMILGVGIYEFV